MSPNEVARAVRLRLAEELVGDRASLTRLVESIRQLAGEAAANTNSVDGETRALALAFQLDRFFTAVESVLTRVLRTLDGDVPSGPDWHQELLRAATVSVAGLRPAVVPGEALPLLRELLGFRHFARHGYDTSPDPARVRALAEVARRAHELVERSLAGLDTRLRADAAAE